MRLDANVALHYLVVLAPTGLSMIGIGRRGSEERVSADSAVLAQAEADLTAIYHQYSQAIHSYAYRLLGNQEDADDVTQEVFIRAHSHLEQLRDPNRLRPWLYRIATNLCLDQQRRRSRIRRAFGFLIPLGSFTRNDDGAEAREISHLTSDAAIDGVAERDHITLALRAMPRKYATCLVLHSAQGLSYREIAEILDITPGVAAVRLARARNLFERQYEALRGEDAPE